MQQASEGVHGMLEERNHMEIPMTQKQTKMFSSIKVMLHYDDRLSTSTNDGRTVMVSNLAS